MKTLLLLCLALPGALRAQSGELWFSGGASILANRNIGSPFSDGQPDDVRLGDGFRAGIRFALNSSGHLRRELQYAYNRTRVTDVTERVLGDPGYAGIASTPCAFNLPYYFLPTNYEQ